MFFQGNEKYNCATYLRLSRSDGDQQESNSIKNQRALLNDYMGKHPELHKFDEYVDDGYSGTNFERPDFKRMIFRCGRTLPFAIEALQRTFYPLGIQFAVVEDDFCSADKTAEEVAEYFNGKTMQTTVLREHVLTDQNLNV